MTGIEQIQGAPMQAQAAPVQEVPQQGGMSPQEGSMGGRTVSGGQGEAELRQKIEAILTQMDPQEVLELAMMDPREAIDILTEKLVSEADIPEEDAVNIASAIFTEILTLVQEGTNMTIEELREKAGLPPTPDPSGQDGQPGQPTNMPPQQAQPTIFGGQNG